jgi:nucleotide-binding universal stress UspA family protein
MKWIVGLDLRPSSQGAVAFAQWLSANMADGGDTFAGVHVLEEAHMQSALRHHHLDELTAEVNRRARQVYTDHQVGDAWGNPVLLRAGNAELGLEQARGNESADGIIIGRQACRDSNDIVRLGRVARRVLRALSAPVVVVPPDIRVGSVGKGPIMALTKLTHDSIAACEAAVALGARLGRDVCLLHVVSVPQAYGAHYLPAGSVEKLRQEHDDQGAKDLQAWAEKYGFKGVDTKLLQGHVQDRVRDHAQANDACMLVIGSRNLSGFDRLLLTSVGSEMCAHAARPVMVVPPGDAN